MDKTYQSIFISDFHLGSKDSKAYELVDFLKSNSCHQLYLVGDIIDAWKMQQNRFYWYKSHTEVIVEIVRQIKDGTQVVYVVGNHDEFLRHLLPIAKSFDLIELVNQTEHIGIDGNRYLVMHGDLFDGITQVAPWLGMVGDRAYEVILSLNSNFNWIRHKFGFGYWSLSQYLKYKLKKTVSIIFHFEGNLAGYCKKRGFDGVICGHIHHAEIKKIGDIIYMNDGDWVESLTALVEHHDGKWEIVYWPFRNFEEGDLSE